MSNHQHQYTTVQGQLEGQILLAVSGVDPILHMVIRHSSLSDDECHPLFNTNPDHLDSSRPDEEQ